jgi:hypothetical protein
MFYMKRTCLPILILIWCGSDVLHIFYNVSMAEGSLEDDSNGQRDSSQWNKTWIVMYISCHRLGSNK